MNRSIDIRGNIIKMASNAFTPILYRQLFKSDFLREITSFKSLQGKKASEYTESDIEAFTVRSEAFSRIAFIMAKQAEIGKASELVKLTVDDYFEWLCGFESGTFTDASVLSKILALWQGNSEDSSVEAKN